MITINGKFTTNESTQELIHYFNNTFGLSNLKSNIPCVLNEDCQQCTNMEGCLWITKSNNNGIKLKKGENDILFKEVSYCWEGIFFYIW